MIGVVTVSRRPGGLDISRRFSASREAVFAALSNVDQLMAWWGPPDYPVVKCTVDFRPGGVWHYLLRGVTTGREIWARSVYREIQPLLRGVKRPKVRSRSLPKGSQRTVFRSDCSPITGRR
jgi:hypothetical protein